MRCRTSLQLSDAPLEIGRKREASACTLKRFLGRSPILEARLGSNMGSGAGSPEGTFSVELDVPSSAESAESRVASLRGTEILKSLDVFFRQDT